MPNNALTYCSHCHSSNVQSRGYEKTSKHIKRRYVCMDCKKGTYLIVHELGDEEFDDSGVRPYIWDDAIANEMISKYKGFVVSCVQNDTTTNYGFVRALQAYCKHMGYRLILIPTRYSNPNAMVRPGFPVFDKSLEQYFIENDLHLNDNIKIVGNVNVSATAVNPISGMNHITQGKTTIIGHPQLQMATVPVNHDEHPIILTTTGTVSNENKYRIDEKNIPKAGYKAMFFRTQSALVIELEDDESFHLRQLIADNDDGFYDWNGYYASDGTIQKGLQEGDVSALVTGDEHWFHMDPLVKEATYGKDENSFVNVFKPLYICRHDILDSMSISSHHNKNRIRKYEKHHTGKDSLESELKLTMDSVFDTTPSNCVSVVIPSNHNEHLNRWLNEGDPNREPWNAKIYHQLMYQCMQFIEDNPDFDPDPLELWTLNEYGEEKTDSVWFLKRGQPFEIHGVILNQHGDRGSSGSRGSPKNFSVAGHKMIIGHSHRNSIEKGVFSVGISARTDLEYTIGAMSGWTQTHCVLYSNGQRQLINITKGRWHA